MSEVPLYVAGYVRSGNMRAAGSQLLKWREAGPPDHDDDKVDLDQWVVSKEVSLSVE